MTRDTGTIDLLIVGGGLAGTLTTWLTKRSAPHLNIVLIEKGAALGGNHTWSFFDTDTDAATLALLKPMIAARWSGYSVVFPKLSRSLSTGYNSIPSDRFHDVIAPSIVDCVRYGVDVGAIENNRVVLKSGDVLEAKCVLDARGPSPMHGIELGYQKFVGIEVETVVPHGETVPVIMDATVEQHDGYRFVYTLPFSPDRILIEDTYYSDSDALDPVRLRQRLDAYARSKGWAIKRVVRDEQGVLPIILAGDIDQFLAHGAKVPPKIGAAASLFHPATGYSLPDAVSLARAIADYAASGRTISTETLRIVVSSQVKSLWTRRKFFRLLNRLLFRAAQPNERYAVLQRFYALNQGLIERFYASRLNIADKARIMAGKPPVPLLPALAQVPERMLGTG
jgi:lycopene beta-cyclase